MRKLVVFFSLLLLGCLIFWAWGVEIINTISVYCIYFMMRGGMDTVQLAGGVLSIVGLWYVARYLLGGKRNGT